MQKEMNTSRPGRILVVDDTTANLQLLTNLLTEHGYTVYPASDGELALEFVRSILPDLILLDIRLPGIDGYEVCRRIKADERTRSIPIIFITILENERDKVKGFQAGAVDYITKPFQSEEVLARVRIHSQIRELTVHLEQKVAERTEELHSANEQLQRELAERKQAEASLRQSERLLNETQRMAKIGGWDWDVTQQTTFWTEETYRIHGFNPQNPISGSPEHIDRCLTCYDPADRPILKAAFQRCVHQGDGYDLEFQFTSAGGCRKWIRTTAAAVHEDGRIIKVVGTIMDITEHKKAEEEREKLQAQFIQAQKMESVGRLAGGVAHDFNNMLGVIMGYTELSMNQVDPALPVSNNLRQIRKAIERSANLTRQLLGFARKQTVDPRVLNLNKTLEGMLNMLKRLIGEDINLVWLPNEELWQIKVDPSQIDQILANLCVNARDAIAGVGRITIETGNIVFNGTYCADHAETVPGEYVMLAVSDDGCGMDRKTRDNIFEPFFTTKVLGKGTGLGLSTVYGIVKQNNGFIVVYSEPGQGTTFRIYLPRHEAKIGQMRKESPAVSPGEGSETILLVEDDPSLMEIMKTILEKFGYRVLAAPMPGEAIRIYREHSGEIHLLLTDVVMPEMTGRELVENLTSLFPGLRCLFMSGYTNDVIAHRGMLDDGVNFIQKPFSMQELAAKVREVLDCRG